MAKEKIKILIRGVNWIGDAIMILPFLYSLRQKFKNAYIVLVVKKWVKDLYNYNSALDEILEYPENKKDYFQLIKRLRAENFDIAIALPKSFSSAFFCFLAGANRRIGFAAQFRSFLLTDRLKFTKELLNKHQINIYLEIAKYLGCRINKIELFLELSESIKQKAKEILPENNYIGIHPGAYFGPAKRWIPEYFAETANKLKKHNYKIVWFGGSGEQKTIDQIKKYFDENDILLVGKTTLDLLAALIKRCKLFIANDSGPMHIAAAVGTPVLAIFGSTNINTTFPFTEKKIILYKQLNCSPCMKRICPLNTYDCMYQITVNDVYNAALKLL